MYCSIQNCSLVLLCAVISRATTANSTPQKNSSIIIENSITDSSGWLTSIIHRIFGRINGGSNNPLSLKESSE